MSMDTWAEYAHLVASTLKSNQVQVYLLIFASARIVSMKRILTILQLQINQSI